MIDGHWLWYAAGRFGRPKGIPKPKVDYLSLRNEIVRRAEADLVKSIVYLTSKSRHIRSFAEILTGFGYEVIIDGGRLPLRFHKDLAETKEWGKLILAVGSLDFLPLLQKLKKSSKEIIMVSFGDLEKELLDIADKLIILGQKVLYDAKQL
jgi:hypothetical protein